MPDERQVKSQSELDIGGCETCVIFKFAFLGKFTIVQDCLSMIND